VRSENRKGKQASFSGMNKRDKRKWTCRRRIENPYLLSKAQYLRIGLQVQRKPDYWLYGSRCWGGMTFIRAYWRNTGSLLLMLKGNIKS